MSTVNALNTISGKVGPVPSHYLTHPVLGKNLVLAEEGQKDYAPELFKPSDAETFAKKQSRKPKASDPQPEVDEPESEATQDSEPD